ncbi:hypothetical protein A4A49_56471 [Nicotiana attenuata]|uniref:Uncharacterized protein n=1 Tax=Nicotiana attenuata TaxID=49451 RepID=A0A1J6ID51_NICAT|nr:hypothetical protein A4A49_56471 [Nicotiana attenuata]
MDRTPTKKAIEQPLHGSPVSHNILYQDLKRDYSKLKREINELIERVVRDSSIDYLISVMLEEHPLTSLYTMLDDMPTPSVQNGAKSNSIIVIISDTESASKTSKSLSVNQNIE